MPQLIFYTDCHLNAVVEFSNPVADVLLLLCEREGIVIESFTWKRDFILVWGKFYRDLIWTLRRHFPTYEWGERCLQTCWTCSFA